MRNSWITAASASTAKTLRNRSSSSSSTKASGDMTLGVIDNLETASYGEESVAWRGREHRVNIRETAEEGTSLASSLYPSQARSPGPQRDGHWGEFSDQTWHGGRPAQHAEATCHPALYLFESRIV